MARSIQTIYDEIIAEKQSMAALTGLQPAIDDSQNLLADLTSTSKVAIWRLWAFLMAVALNIHENIFDLHKAEVEALGDTLITGTRQWYQSEAFRWQFGDSQAWNGVKFAYPTITPANQIIKFAAVQEGGGLVLIKVAKDDGSGNPAKLTAPELSAFSDFVEEVKFAGTVINKISDDADDIKLNYDVKVSPQILNDTTGEDVNNPGVFPVVDAINNYFKTLPFDGIIFLAKITDAIQAVEGVEDVTLNSADAKFGALSYAPITKEYNPNAGHAILDEPSSTFTYSS